MSELSRAQLAEYAHLAEQAAKAGGQILQEWQHKFSVREKGPADLVTEADLASQETIRALVQKAFPTHAFLGEEDPRFDVLSHEFVWVVDPLDGTTNYVHGVPDYCVSVALLRGGEPIVGCVYQPLMQESYTAAKGQGAQLNGQPIQVSETQRVKEAMVAVSFPPRVKRTSPEFKRFTEVLEESRATRRMGSSALNLSYVACGRYDAYWSTETKIWDIAAGLLLVQEAGGTVEGLEPGTDLDLRSPRFVAACTPLLCANLKELLNRSGE